MGHRDAAVRIREATADCLAAIDAAAHRTEPTEQHRAGGADSGGAVSPLAGGVGSRRLLHRAG